MKKIKLTISIALMTFTLFAQDYPFISKDLHQMNDKEMLDNNVQFNPNTMLMFDNKGNKITANQINDIMMSGNFMPVIFGDANHKAKALVFRASTLEEKKQLKLTLAAQNPNANFEPGQRAIAFTTTDINGESIDLKNLLGKVVVLNFWFTECHGCVAEMPELNKIVAKYKDQNVAFIAVTFDSNKKINKFLKTHQFDYTIVSDMSIIKNYQVSTFPLSMVIDQSGEIIFKKVGPYLNEMDIKIGLLLKK